MLQISQSQWDTMGQGSFDARIIAILRTHHPKQVNAMPFAELVHMIHRQTARAAVYGLNDERSAAQYVYTGWLMGEEFDTRIPSLRQILRDRTLTAAEKSTALSHFNQLVFGALEGAAVANEERAMA
jgi:hypothetical protein